MEERDIIQLEKCCCCCWVSLFHVTLDQIFSMHNTVQVRMTKIFSLSKSAEIFCVTCESWRGTCARLAASGRVELAAVPPAWLGPNSSPPPPDQTGPRTWIGHHTSGFVSPYKAHTDQAIWSKYGLYTTMYSWQLAKPPSLKD